MAVVSAPVPVFKDYKINYLINLSPFGAAFGRLFGSNIIYSEGGIFEIFHRTVIP
jgi:hypothetical protein